MKIRNLEIWPPVALAPMVGLSHSALRSLVNREGGAGIFFTEMLAAKRLPHENANCSPLLVRGSDEKPLIYQIICADEKHIPKAVDKLHELGADGIDINLGCPAPRLKKQGAGASLAENPELMCRIVRGVRKRTELPVSVKIRLGKRDSKDTLPGFCTILEDQGIDFLTIHARYTGEKFCRQPRWHEITHAKKVLSIPIIANGGIFSVDDARKCLNDSGADGLMVGRGAVARPWLLAEISSEIYGIHYEEAEIERPALYFSFAHLLMERFGAERRLGRLKQFTHYFASTYKFGHHLAMSVQGSDSFDEALGNATLFFENTNG